MFGETMTLEDVVGKPQVLGTLMPNAGGWYGRRFDATFDVLRLADLALLRTLEPRQRVTIRSRMETDREERFFAAYVWPDNCLVELIGCGAPTSSSI